MTDDVPRLLKAAEVAAMFRVHRATVARWKGLTVIKTPGGDRRYLEAEVLAYLDIDAAPKIFPSGVGGELAPDGAQRPAGLPPAEALAGRNGTGAPGRFGGAVTGERPCQPTPRTEGSTR